MASTGFTSRKRQRRCDDNDSHPAKRRSNIPSSVAYMGRIHYGTSSKPPPTVLERLGFEVQSLGVYLEPDPVDHARRLGAVECLKRRVQSLFPGSEVHLSGSLATGLYLPTSDIDVTVVWEGGRRELGRAGYAVDFLEQLHVMFQDDPEPPLMELRRSARVPILALEHSYGNYSIDISVDQLNGPRAAVKVNEFLASRPVLRPLALIIKLFLAQEGLNKPYNGGIGSFGTVCMIWGFLQLHPRIIDGSLDPKDPQQWGCLLLDFFAFYGFHFNYACVGISLKDGGKYIELGGGQLGFFLEDPLGSGHSIFHFCRVGLIQNAFQRAHAALSKAIAEQETYNRRHPKMSWVAYLAEVGMGPGSLLHSIIGLDPEVMGRAAAAEKDYPIEGLSSFLQNTGGHGSWQLPG